MNNGLAGWCCIFFLGVLLAYSQAAAQEPPRLVCQVYCSETKLRTGIAELTWSTRERAVATRGEPELDVTVFYKGFERGSFQSFGKITPQATPRPVSAPTRDLKSDTRKMRAYDLILRVPGSKRAITAGGEVKQRVEIENLEPGVLYRFRLRGLGAEAGEVTCEAPVCPADMKEGKVP